MRVFASSKHYKYRSMLLPYEFNSFIFLTNYSVSKLEVENFILTGKLPEIHRKGQVADCNLEV